MKKKSIFFQKKSTLSIDIPLKVEYNRFAMGGDTMQISLKAARVNAELSQQSVANILKISKSTLINWEKGRTSPDVIQMKELCKIYKISLNDIFLQSKST